MPMYENAAIKISNSIKNENNVEVINNEASILIKGSKLDEVAQLYWEAMSNHGIPTIIVKTSKDNKITVFFNKKKKMITDILIED